MPAELPRVGERAPRRSVRLAPSDTWPDLRFVFRPLPWHWKWKPRVYVDDPHPWSHATVEWLFLTVEWWAEDKPAWWFVDTPAREAHSRALGRIWPGPGEQRVRPERLGGMLRCGHWAYVMPGKQGAPLPPQQPAGHHLDYCERCHSLFAITECNVYEPPRTDRRHPAYSGPDAMSYFGRTLSDREGG